MKRPLILVALFCSACGSSSPTAPTSAASNRPLTLFLSGQSNAGFDPNPEFPLGFVALGDALREAGVTVRRVSQGGVPISAWAPVFVPRYEHDPDWLSPAFDQALQSPDPYDAFVWFQGESDATDLLLPTYEQSALALFARVRRARPGLRIVICGLEDYTVDRPHWDAMRAIQQRLSSEAAPAVYVSTLDLPTQVGGQHLLPAGYAQLVERIKAAVAQ